MRSLPFKLVYVLGLGEGEFPEDDAASTLDLRGYRRVIGDVDPSARNRYLFLETPDLRHRPPAAQLRLPGRAARARPSRCARCWPSWPTTWSNACWRTRMGSGRASVSPRFPCFRDRRPCSRGEARGDRRRKAGPRALGSARQPLPGGAPPVLAGAQEGGVPPGGGEPSAWPGFARRGLPRDLRREVFPEASASGRRPRRPRQPRRPDRPGTAGAAMRKS